MNASNVSKGILQQLKLYMLGATVASAMILPGSALGEEWEYAKVPLFWSTGATPNVALLIDDSGSMAAIVAGEAYQKAYAANAASITDPWYWCDGNDYNPATQKCGVKGTDITYFNVFTWAPPSVSSSTTNITSAFSNSDAQPSDCSGSVTGFARNGTSGNTLNGTICLAGSTFTNGMALRYTTAASAPTLTGLSVGTTYYVINAVAGKGFKLASTITSTTPIVPTISAAFGTGNFVFTSYKPSANLPTYIASEAAPPAAKTVALCDVSKEPGTPGYFVGPTGTAPWLSSATLPTASTVGVMVSDTSTDTFTGTRDSCVRWKMLTTANSATVAPGNKDYSVNWAVSPGVGANLGTAYLAPGGEKDSDATKFYARYLLNTFIKPLTAPAAANVGNFDGNAIYLDTDPDPKNYVAATDKFVIPRVTRMQAARESVQQIVLDNYTRMNIGLFSFFQNSSTAQMDREIMDGSDPETDKTALIGANETATLAGTQDGLVGALVPNTNTPLEQTQTYINTYFDGGNAKPSPVQYRCQKNYTVVLTDGMPSSGSQTAMEVAAEAGYNDDFKTSGNDAANGSYQDPKWPTQNLETFTVGFGLENNVLKRTPLVNRVDVDKSAIVGSEIKLKKASPTSPDVAHGLDTGDYVQVFSNAATGLTAGNYYYAVKVDAYKFRLAAASAAGDTGTTTTNTRQKAFDCAASAPAYTAASGCITITGGSGTMVMSIGPGKAFFAQTPDQLSDKLGDVFSKIAALTASASAVSTNSKQLGDDTLVYQARFNTEDWSGEVAAYPVDPISGAVSTALGNETWTTKETLNTNAVPPTDWTTRNILTWNKNTNLGVTFNTLTNIGAINSAALNSDLNAVNWLRGATVAGFRSHSKDGLMGDIINADPVFVGALNFGFNTLPPSPTGCSASTCTGQESYSTYLANRKATATPMLFVGSNGGQMHVLNSSNGTELMAFVPAGVYENWDDTNNNGVKDTGETERKLYNLTQSTYDHRFFVDGAGATSDVYINNNWKTYFVGALGAGGRSVYAIDASDATFTNADIKWEFSNANLGYTYGKPIIARFSNNKWYAVFPNGTDSYGDKASVFAVNIDDVADVHELTVSNGDSSANPNGMMTVAVAQDNYRTAQYIYAGDMKGNIWKFDVSTAGSWPTGTKLFTATDPGGMQQSITGGIRVGKNPVAPGNLVYFGTGKYFEIEDRSYSTGSTPQVDTFYAVFDDGTTGLTRASLQQQVLATSGGWRTMPSPQTVDYDTEYGWYVDLLEGTTKKGERMVSTPILSGGRIIFVTVVPSGGDKCISSGYSWLNELNALSGNQITDPILDTDNDGDVDSADVPKSGQKLDGMASEPSILQSADGKTEKKIMGTTSATGSILTVSESPAGSSAVGGSGRMSWQQIQ